MKATIVPPVLEEPLHQRELIFVKELEDAHHGSLAIDLNDVFWVKLREEFWVKLSFINKPIYPLTSRRLFMERRGRLIKASQLLPNGERQGQSTTIFYRPNDEYYYDVTRYKAPE